MKDARFENGDGQSDISDNATRSVDEIQEEYDSEFEEKFRVDRKKLELMLLSSNEHEDAEHFFQRVMDETNTVISWPSKLKIGAKSKKDPHVKLTGQPDAIREAKAKIKAVLDTRKNIVSLKMDVSHTDHSHIIGKSGNNIQKVVEVTKCHIHFPDSNRNNPIEKSNQVTINGQLQGVEQSRVHIRGMLPLVFMFELPVPQLNARTSPFIQELQKLYEVQVYFKPQHATPCTVIVRGSERWAYKVKEGTRKLLEYLMGTACVTVMMTVEITMQHHAKLKEYSKSIMKATGTTITFPDNNAGGPLLSKSAIVIAGGIENVHRARKQIMEYLPLVLIFDLNEDQNVNYELNSRLSRQFGISVYAKQKMKKCGVSISLKGLEKDASNLYEARRILLGLEKSDVPDVVTCSCPLPDPLGASNGHVDVEINDTEFQSHNVLNINVTNALYRSPLSSPSLPLQPTLGLSTGGWSTSSTFPGFCPVLSCNFPLSTRGGVSTTSDMFHMQNPCMRGCYPGHDAGFYSAPSSTTSSLSSPSQSPRHGSPVEGSSYTTRYCGVPSETVGGNDSVMNLLQRRSGSDSLQTSNIKTAMSTMSYMEPLNSERPTKDQKIEHKAPGCELKTLPCSFPSDYENKQLLASKAIRKKPQEPEVRIPNSVFSGYGFSQSMPESAHRLLRQECPSFEQNGSPSTDDVGDSDKDPWKNSPTSRLSSRKVNGLGRRNAIDLGSSNYIDSASLPLCSSSFIGKCTLTDLLNNLRLTKYTQLFQQQEIDLDTFLSMTDQDLKDLGITTFGARRKMLLAIAELKEQPSAFSAAPGAERKLSSSSVTGGSKADVSPPSSFW